MISAFVVSALATIAGQARVRVPDEHIRAQAHAIKLTQVDNVCFFFDWSSNSLMMHHTVRLVVRSHKRIAGIRSALEHASRGSVKWVEPQGGAASPSDEIEFKLKHGTESRFWIIPRDLQAEWGPETETMFWHYWTLAFHKPMPSAESPILNSG